MDWDEMAKPWLAAGPDLEVAFQDIFRVLFEAANLRPGERVLDIGCGTGPTLPKAAKAIGPSGRLVGIDIAPPLLARASERMSDAAELVVGDAATHTFPPDTFDAIIANFGIMFFEDTQAAFAHLRQAVRPGGRLAATVWGPPSDNPWFAVPRQIIDAHVPDVPRPDPAAPGPMRFGDPSGLVKALVASGWHPQVTTKDIHLTPPGPASRVAQLHMLVTAVMMLKDVDASEDTIRDISAALETAMSEFESGTDIHVPARIHVITATAV